jgi:hypothetical protein
MAPFSTLTIKNRAYVTLYLARLMYRANENEVTQKNLRNIENFKTKTTDKKQMMFCIARVKTKCICTSFFQCFLTFI